MSAKDKLPPVNQVPENLDGRGILKITEYGCGSWCPTPDGSGPAEAVVLHFKVGGLNQCEFGLKLGSVDRVNELIAMLERHRDDVWPETQPKNEEKKVT